MRKKIAVDIDDVLSASAEGFVAWSNQRWGLNLTVDDYDERWGVMWKTDHDTQESDRRAVEFHHAKVVGKYKHRAEAEPVLRRLSKRFELVIVTSRRLLLQEETEEWLTNNFPNLFSEIHYAGMWDNNSPDRHNATKTELCREIGADFLIDDQLKHCLAAADAGIPALLFGRYAWNRAKELPRDVTRCEDWEQVERYFD